MMVYIYGYIQYYYIQLLLLIALNLLHSSHNHITSRSKSKQMSNSVVDFEEFEEVDAAYIDSYGKKLFLIKYPADFDLDSLNGKKLDMSKTTKLKLQQEQAIYTIHRIGAQTYGSMRPIVLNSLTNEACIGENFVDCLSITKSYSAKIDENVDLSISGYNKIPQQGDGFAHPRLPIGSQSNVEELKIRLADRISRRCGKQKNENPEESNHKNKKAKASPSKRNS